MFISKWLRSNSILRQTLRIYALFVMLPCKSEVVGPKIFKLGDLIRTSSLSDIGITWMALVETVGVSSVSQTVFIHSFTQQ